MGLKKTLFFVFFICSAMKILLAKLSSRPWLGGRAEGRRLHRAPPGRLEQSPGKWPSFSCARPMPTWTSSRWSLNRRPSISPWNANIPTLFGCVFKTPSSIITFISLNTLQKKCSFQSKIPIPSFTDSIPFMSVSSLQSKTYQVHFPAHFFFHYQCSKFDTWNSCSIFANFFANFYLFFRRFISFIFPDYLYYVTSVLLLNFVTFLNIFIHRRVHCISLCF